MEDISSSAINSDLYYRLLLSLENTQRQNTLILKQEYYSINLFSLRGDRKTSIENIISKISLREQSMKIYTVDNSPLSKIVASLLEKFITNTVLRAACLKRIDLRTRGGWRVANREKKTIISKIDRVRLPMDLHAACSRSALVTRVK